MSRYDSEQEKFYGRVNDVTDIYVGYKLNQFIYYAILFVIMLLFRLDIPFISFITSFAVVWGFSYAYTQASIVVISFISAFFAEVRNKTQKHRTKFEGSFSEKVVNCLSYVGKISFISTCVLLFSLSFVNDPQALAWKVILFPFYVLFEIAKVIFGV